MFYLILFMNMNYNDINKIANNFMNRLIEEMQTEAEILHLSADI